MTPAVKAAQAAGVAITLHEYAHDPANSNYGLEAADALGLDPQQVFKPCWSHSTAPAQARGRGRADRPARPEGDGHRLQGETDMAIRRRRDCDRVHRRRHQPAGTEKRLLRVDASAEAFDTVYVSGGQRGLDIGIAPLDLVRLCAATLADIGR